MLNLVSTMSLHKDEESQHGMNTILTEDKAVAPADRTDPAKDDDGLNPDGDARWFSKEEK